MTNKKKGEYDEERTTRALTIKDFPRSLMTHFAAACKLREMAQRDVLVMLVRRWLKEDAQRKVGSD